MNGLFMFLIHLYALSSPITMTQRCTRLDSSSLVAWMHDERTRGRQHHDLAHLAKRQKPWLPDIKLSAGVTINDGDQYRILDGTALSDLRTSAVSEGAHRTEYEVSFKWFLSTHTSSASHLSWQRFLEHEHRQREASTNRFVRVFSRWVSAIEQRCKKTPPTGVDAALFTLELELEQLSEGRFYRWLKEKK